MYLSTITWVTWTRSLHTFEPELTCCCFYPSNWGYCRGSGKIIDVQCWDINLCIVRRPRFRWPISKPKGFCKSKYSWNYVLYIYIHCLRSRSMYFRIVISFVLGSGCRRSGYKTSRNNGRPPACEIEIINGRPILFARTHMCIHIHIY